MPRSKPTMSRVITTALPGAAELDQSLVDQAVADLNRLHAAKGLETARAMGEYVVARFFGGEIDAFETQGRSHVSFGALAAREDLQVSKSALWYAVRLLPQLRQLPEDLVVALPLSHHRLLLHVEDPAAKARLAERTVADGLSKRDLAREIESLKRRYPDAPARGRPPTPGFVKALGRLKKVTEAVGATEVDEAALLTYGLDRTRKVLDEVEHGLAQLTAMRDQIAARLGEVEARSRGGEG